MRTLKSAPPADSKPASAPPSPPQDDEAATITKDGHGANGDEAWANGVWAPTAARQADEALYERSIVWRCDGVAMGSLNAHDDRPTVTAPTPQRRLSQPQPTSVEVW